LAAILSGLSCRQAAIRFGVSASSAIRWRTMERMQGDATPKAVGGDRRSMRIDRHAGAIGALVDEMPDITLEELRAVLAARGVSTSYGALWRFFRRHKITRKKDRACGRAGSPGYREAPREPGSKPSWISTRSAWCSSTRLGLRPT
jgi:transposase